MKLSDAIAEYLIKIGIRTVFGYQGGSITHMIDSFDRAGLNYIQTYNEQGASLAADAYARVAKERIGVAIGTNGPGATNMITGIANAFCDSVPVLFFTGQVHTFAMKSKAEIRQESFQEIDILPIVKPITKYAVTIMKSEDAIPEIEKAIQIALSDRPGPVLIDLPVDVQGQDIPSVNGDFPTIHKIVECNLEKKVEEIKSILKNAKRPLVIAGGGIRTANATEKFQEFVRYTGIPTVCSLMGLDVLAHNCQEFVGFIGGYGNRYANIAIQNADVILVLGSRLDMRQTGKRKDLFASQAFLIHVDTDEFELEHFVKEGISLCCDLDAFLDKMVDNHSTEKINDFKEWKNTINEWKKQYPAEMEVEDDLWNNPNWIIHTIGKALPQNVLITCDVGQNQMWIAQSLRVWGDECRILNSGGLGTMGYALPAAIGAHYARENSIVVAFMGDGGLQMNIQELQVIGQRKLPIKIVVFNNHALGLIRDIHEKYYDCNYVGSVRGFGMPQLPHIAEAYNIGYRKLDCAQDLADIKTCFCNNLPEIIEVELKGNTYIRPELLGNDSLEHQIPYKE